MTCTLVWLAMMAAAFHMAQTRCGDAPQGDVRVIGINTNSFKAGYIEICAGGMWRAVCQEGWNRNAARVVCRQLFPEGPGLPAGLSCLGEREKIGGAKFKCNGEETELFQCSKSITRADPCTDLAGVACYLPTSLINDGTAETQSRSRETGPLAALGGGLGALTVLLATLLVGVVIGWVRSCRKLRKSERRINSRTITNPAYNPTSPSTTTPSSQHSHQSPRSLSQSTSHPVNEAQPSQQDRIYHELEDPGHQGGGGRTERMLEDPRHQRGGGRRERLEDPGHQGGGGRRERVYHELEDPRHQRGNQRGGGRERIYHVLESRLGESEGRGTGGREGELEGGDYHLLGEEWRGHYEMSVPAQPAATQPAEDDTDYSVLQHL